MVETPDGHKSLKLVSLLETQAAQQFKSNYNPGWFVVAWRFGRMKYFVTCFIFPVSMYILLKRIVRVNEKI